MTDGASQGLFVIVAVIIFGIFVAIAYALFGDNFKKVMGDIFEDSTQKVIDDLDNADKSSDNDGSTDTNNNTADYTKLAKVGDTAYYNIRDNVWVLVKRLNDTDVSIIDSGTEDNFTVENYGKGLGDSKALVISEQIFGFNVTEIGEKAFWKSTFSSTFTANSVKTFGDISFYTSKFTGTFTANNVKTIGTMAFRDSTFTGDFINNSVETINDHAFLFSTFTGNFTANNLTTIYDNAFFYSTFKGNFTANNLTTIELQSFYNSPFTGTFTAPNLTTIGSYAFYISTFSKVTAEKLTVDNVEVSNGNIAELLNK